MIAAPQATRSLVRSVLTVACVPMGINMGVSKLPCGVCSRPRRAWLWASVWRSSNVSGIAAHQSQPPAAAAEQRSSKTTVRKIVETIVLTQKGEFKRPSRAISLFGNIDFSNALPVLGVIDFTTIDQGDHVGILLNGSRLTQIG